MTIRPAVRRLYIPSVGQADAAARASALAAVLAPAELIQDSRYGSRITQAPAVVLDFGYDVVVVLEPTTHAAVDAAQDAFLDDQLPDTVARLSDVATSIGTELTDAVAAHSAATNPHGITPATIGAAASTHTHADNEIPGSVARDSEVDSKIEAHAGLPHGTTPHSHIATDLPAGLEESAEIVQAVAAHESLPNPHPGYATDTDLSTHASGPHGTQPHSHVDAELPAGLARDAEVASMYSPVAHNHDAVYAPVHPHPYATDTHTHAGGGVSGGTIRKTANQTMTATAQTAVADMSFPVAAGGTYFFMMLVAVGASTGTSAATAWGFTGPAGATVSVIGEIDTSTSVETTVVLAAFGNFASGAQVANSGARFSGVIQTGATAGTVQLTAARSGTTPNMTVAAGSHGFWMRVA